MGAPRRESDRNFISSLFSKLERQQSSASKVANSFRKAYLCHSKIRKIRPGDATLFYRSQDDESVTAMGVADLIVARAVTSANGPAKPTSSS